MYDLRVTYVLSQDAPNLSEAKPGSRVVLPVPHVSVAERILSAVRDSYTAVPGTTVIEIRSGRGNRFKRLDPEKVYDLVERRS